MGTRENRLGEAVPTCTHNLCFEQKYEKYQNFSTKFFNFLQLKKNQYIAWQDLILFSLFAIRKRFSCDYDLIMFSVYSVCY